MKILLTNDDGITGQGLITLADYLRKDHEVCVVAPSANRSGASSSITMNKKLLLNKLGDSLYALDGSPVDCVVSAMRGDYLPFKPDLLISGINADGNIGTDIVYSGTCGAARQAAIYGLPSIAVSLERNRKENEAPFKFPPLADFIAKNLENLIALCLKDRNIKEGEPCKYFLNVNAPSADSYQGVKFASISFRDYRDHVCLVEEDGRTYSLCTGGKSILSLGDCNCDASLVEQGYVTLSLLHTEPFSAVVNENLQWIF